MKNFEDFLKEFNEIHLNSLVNKTQEIVKERFQNISDSDISQNPLAFSTVISATVAEISANNCVILLRAYHEWLHE